MEYQRPSTAPDITNPNFIPVEEPCGQDIELYLSGRNLKDLDTFSKSDPQVRVYIKDKPTAATWRKVGETEVIQNNLNPDWKTTITVFYQFEVSQQVRIEVVDSDGKDSTELIG